MRETRYTLISESGVEAIKDKRVDAGTAEERAKAAVATAAAAAAFAASVVVAAADAVAADVGNNGMSD